MPRISAQDRAAQAAERLNQVSAEQQKIAEQTIKAIENGIDPEIAVSIAEAAAKEIGKPVEIVEEISVQSIDISSSQKQVKIKAAHITEESSPSNYAFTLKNGRTKFFKTDENFEAIVDEDLALELCERNIFVLAEEE